MRTPVTIWKRFNDETRCFEHNHIEDGHIPHKQETPTAVTSEQARNWKGALWIRRFGYLEDGVVRCE